MIIEGDPISARGKFSRRLRAPLVIGLIVLLVIATIAGFIARDLIVRNTVLHSLENVTGAQVTVGSVRGTFGAYTIDALHCDADGIALDAARVDVRSNPLAIVLHDPHLTLDRAALRGEREPVARTLAWLAQARARVQLDDASLDVADGAEVRASDGSATPVVVAGSQAAGVTAAPTLLQVVPVDGTIAFDPLGDAYELHATIVSAGTRYPFVARATFSDGVMHRRFTADALPLAPLLALQAADQRAMTQGELRTLVFTDDGTPHADATLADVALRLGTHSLRYLDGAIALRGAQLGSGDLHGKLDGARFTFAGTLHDISDLGAALRMGTPDLRILARLITIVAGRPGLHDVHTEMTAPGIAFAQYGQTTDAGPRAISLVAIDPTLASVHFGTAIAADHVISRGERTSQLAQRTGAVAGVNGDYFDIGRTYEPQGLLIRDGRLVRGPTDRAALVIDRTNGVTFAEFHLRGSLESRGRSVPVTQFNTWPPGPGDATVITPDYGDVIPALADATFVRLRPTDAAKGEYAATEIVPAADAPKVSFGVGLGPNSAIATPRVGDRFTLRYGLEPRVRDVVAGIGGGPILLRNGAWYEDPHAPAPAERDVRWPVIALGSLPGDLLVFAAVDGRHPERAVGMTRPEFADLLRSFGVRDAMALDSGGSVTLVSRAPGDDKATVRNTPSDDSAERYISDALFVFSSAPPDTLLTPTPAPQASPTAAP